MPGAVLSRNLPVRRRAGSNRSSRNSTPLSTRSSVPASRKRKAATTNRRSKRPRRSATPEGSDSESDEEAAIEIEAPLPVDFEGFGIPRDQYIRDPLFLATIPRDPSPLPKFESDGEPEDENDIAPPPSIFSAYANPGFLPARGRQSVFRASPRATTQTRAQTQQPQAPQKKASLMGVPMEVRECIYRHILISSKPIPVYDGWKRVYQREKPALDTSILLVNRRINKEGTGILYRENTFLYRLRDAPGPSHQIIGAQRLKAAHNYVPRAGLSRTSKHESGTINIAKFGEDIRYLTIQADHNRVSAQTQEFMVEAIKAFAKTPGKMNVHTLQIVISPQLISGNFTFVNFFRPDSTLIEALRGISCEKVVIQVWNKFLNNGAGKSRTEIKLPLHHLRFAKHRKQQVLEGARKDGDLWKGDRLMREFRKKGIRWCNKQLAELGDRILEACRKHVQEDVMEEALFFADGAGESDDESAIFLAGDEGDEGSDAGNDEDSDFEPEGN